MLFALSILVASQELKPCTVSSDMLSQSQRIRAKGLAIAGRKPSSAVPSVLGSERGLRILSFGDCLISWEQKPWLYLSGVGFRSRQRQSAMDAPLLAYPEIVRYANRYAKAAGFPTPIQVLHVKPYLDEVEPYYELHIAGTYKGVAYGTSMGSGMDIRAIDGLLLDSYFLPLPKLPPSLKPAVTVESAWQTVLDTIDRRHAQQGTQPPSRFTFVTDPMLAILDLDPYVIRNDRFHQQTSELRRKGKNYEGVLVWRFHMISARGQESVANVDAQTGKMAIMYPTDWAGSSFGGSARKSTSKPFTWDVQAPNVLVRGASKSARAKDGSVVWKEFRKATSGAYPLTVQFDSVVVKCRYDAKHNLIVTRDGDVDSLGVPNKTLQDVLSKM